MDWLDYPQNYRSSPRFSDYMHANYYLIRVFCFNFVAHFNFGIINRWGFTIPRVSFVSYFLIWRGISNYIWFWCHIPGNVADYSQSGSSYNCSSKFLAATFSSSCKIVNVHLILRQITVKEKESLSLELINSIDMVVQFLYGGGEQLIKLKYHMIFHASLHT